MCAVGDPLPAWFDRGLRTAVYALVAFSITGMPLAMAGWFRPPVGSRIL